MAVTHNIIINVDRANADDITGDRSNTTSDTDDNITAHAIAIIEKKSPTSFLSPTRAAPENPS